MELPYELADYKSWETFYADVVHTYHVTCRTQVNAIRSSSSLAIDFTIENSSSGSSYGYLSRDRSKSRNRGRHGMDLLRPEGSPYRASTLPN